MCPLPCDKLWLVNGTKQTLEEATRLSVTTGVCSSKQPWGSHLRSSSIVWLIRLCFQSLCVVFLFSCIGGIISLKYNVHVLQWRRGVQGRLPLSEHIHVETANVYIPSFPISCYLLWSHLKSISLVPRTTLCDRKGLGILEWFLGRAHQYYIIVLNVIVFCCFRHTHMIYILCGKRYIARFH